MTTPIEEAKERIAEITARIDKMTDRGGVLDFGVGDMKALAQSHSQLQEENEAMRKQFSAITRVEVITDERNLVVWNLVDTRFSIQDEGRTLKIFAKKG